MAEVEPIECLCRGRARQDDFAPVPLCYPHRHQVSYELVDGLSSEPQLRLEGAGIYRLFRSGDVDKRSDGAWPCFFARHEASYEAQLDALERVGQKGGEVLEVEPALSRGSNVLQKVRCGPFIRKTLMLNK